jgi:hypothetical protein
LGQFFLFIFCVKRIICGEVSDAACCWTYIWQLQYILYFNIALYFQLLMTLKRSKVKQDVVIAWDRIKEKGKVRGQYICNNSNWYTAKCTTKHTATYITRNSKINN